MAANKIRKTQFAYSTKLWTTPKPFMLIYAEAVIDLVTTIIEKQLDEEEKAIKPAQIPLSPSNRQQPPHNRQQ